MDAVANFAEWHVVTDQARYTDELHHLLTSDAYAEKRIDHTPVLLKTQHPSGLTLYHWHWLRLYNIPDRQVEKLAEEITKD